MKELYFAPFFPARLDFPLISEDETKISIGANLSSGQRRCSASLQPDRAVAVATNCYVIYSMEFEPFLGGGLVGGRGRGINGKVVTLPSNIGSFWPVAPQTFLCNLSITQSRLSSSTNKKETKGRWRNNIKWWKYESHILEPRHDEIAVKDATCAVAKRKLKKFRLAEIRTLTSTIPRDTGEGAAL